MTDARETDVVPTAYRQRWAPCETCESVVIVQRDDHRGVPDEQQWEEFPHCPVCGDSLGSHWNADEHTEQTKAWQQGSERVRVAVAAARADERERCVGVVRDLPGPDNAGLARWPDESREVYLLAVEEACAALDAPTNPPVPSRPT